MSDALPRVLLVEDEPVTMAFLASALEGMPLVLDQAATAGEALRLAGRNPPALVLLDLHLPDGDGVDTLRRLLDSGIGCPVVALTADASARPGGALAGFAAVAHKPLALDHLRRLVLQWLDVGKLPAPMPTLPPATAAGSVAEPPALRNDGENLPHSDGDGLPHSDGGLPRSDADDAPHRDDEDGLLHWDDAGALQALAGRREILVVLRGLLLADLPGQLASIDVSWRSDAPAACAVLHRLQAAASFCGAARLAAAARSLEAALQHGDATVQSLQRLRAAATALATAPPSRVHP